MTKSHVTNLSKLDRRSIRRKSVRMKSAMLFVPAIMTLLPALMTIALLVISAGGPSAAVLILFFGAIATAFSMVAGITIAALMARRHSRWKNEVKEQISAFGIAAEDIEWFKSELKPSEKKALRDLSRKDILLYDAYRETLSSRLTASRIVRRSSAEMRLVRNNMRKLAGLSPEKKDPYLSELERDLSKLGEINSKAKNMLAEAESRLRMIEAAGSRGAGFSEFEVALKKLESRSSAEPPALEAAKLAEEIKRELEKST